MKTLIAGSFLILGLVSVTAFAGIKETLNSIAENAQVGNGSATVKNYDVKTFDVKAALTKDLTRIKKNFADNDMKCGPYGATTDRRETIAATAKLTSDKPTADALTALYNAKQILKMYSIHTNNNVECSQMWVEVYTTDGWLLDLYYGMND